MLGTGGNGNAYARWDSTNKQWEFGVGGSDVLTVGENTVNINKETVVAGDFRETGNLTLTGTLGVSGDLNVAGGVAQTFTFYRQGTVADAIVTMTASTIFVTGAVEPQEQVFMRQPLIRSGSVLGVVLYSENCAIDHTTGGALTASVTLDGVQSAVQVIMTTGSILSFIQAKDTTTFNGLQTLGVVLTASEYLDDFGSTSSGSWCASVLVEY